MNNKNVTSREYNKLKLDALALITSLRDAQRTLNRIHEQAAALNINTLRKDGQTETEWLGSLATTATELEHDLAKREATEEVQNTLNGQYSPREPRTIVGRVLNRVARIAG